MNGLHSLSIGKSHGDAVLGGDFVGAGFVWGATRVYNCSDIVGWFEGRN